MTANDDPFLRVCADFLRQHVMMTLSRCLADETGQDAGREPLVAYAAAWLADVAAGRDAAALEPERLVQVLETIWLLSIVGLLPPPEPDSRFVDLALWPGLTRVLDLALAAVSALDLLRDTDVVGVFHRRQITLVDTMARAADPGAAGAHTMN